MEFLESLPLLPIHIGATIVTISFVIIADLHGLAWVMGKVETLPERRMRWLHRLVWIGLLSTMTAGFLMALPYWDFLIDDTAFRIKLGFVAALVINAFAIGRHAHVAIERPFRELTRRERLPLFISGAVSTIAWIGALTAAQFLPL